MGDSGDKIYFGLTTNFVPLPAETGTVPRRAACAGVAASRQTIPSKTKLLKRE
jgi:hypothetical protein